MAQARAASTGRDCGIEFICDVRSECERIRQVTKLLSLRGSGSLIQQHDYAIGKIKVPNNDLTRPVNSFAICCRNTTDPRSPIKTSLPYSKRWLIRRAFYVRSAIAASGTSAFEGISTNTTYPNPSKLYYVGMRQRSRRGLTTPSLQHSWQP